LQQRKKGKEEDKSGLEAGRHQNYEMWRSCREKEAKRDGEREWAVQDPVGTG